MNSDNFDALLCVSCGKALTEVDRFCGSCGTPRSEKSGNSEALPTHGGAAFKEQSLDSSREISEDSEDAEEISYPYALYPEAEMESSDEDYESLNRPLNEQKKNGKYWLIGGAAILVVGVMLAASNKAENMAISNGSDTTQVDTSGSSTSSDPTTQEATQPDPTPTTEITSTPKQVVKATPRKVDQCAIGDQTIADLVNFKNLLATIPTGRNDASHTNIILQWADSANNTADLMSADSIDASGAIVSVIDRAANDLTALSNLASDWANNNLNDPTSFASDYAAAATLARNDYVKMTAICGDKLP